MYRIALIFITVISLGPIFLVGQSYSQDYFRSPVNGKMRIIGTFGELRSNHFHAGIDVKGPVGQTLFAVADGTIVRIKIEKGGYGKALYISHPNGYTSVYAHMEAFTPEVEAFVKQQQERLQKFQVNLYPKAGQFTFKKGDVVGKMGMKGYAFGPHLHFEIRETKSQAAVNPLLFGLGYQDNVRPRLHLLKLYALNQEHQTLFTKSYNLLQKGNAYGVGGDTIQIGAWRVGLGIKAFDHMNDVSNWNGFYKLQTYVDDQLVFDFDFEKYAFSETRYINAHVDYEAKTTQKSDINRCYRLPGNYLSIYNHKQKDGVIALSKSLSKKVVIRVEDVHGNESKAVFWLKRKEVAPTNFPDTYNYLLPHKEPNIIKTQSAQMDFAKGSFYEDIYLQYRITSNAAGNCYSDMHHIHERSVPVHKYYKLSLTPIALPQQSLDKAFIAFCDDDEYASYGGTWKNGRLSASVRNFGDFCIMIDETAPKIQPIIFKSDMRGYNKMTFKITDNIEVTGRAKDLQYEAKIDGRWILMEYDLKNDLLTHRFDEKTAAGKHELILRVWDDRKNETTFKRSFTR